MERAVFVYTTHPSTVEADWLCAAGAQGKIERGEEAVMIVKTRASLAPAASQLITVRLPFS